MHCVGNLEFWKCLHMHFDYLNIDGVYGCFEMEYDFSVLFLQFLWLKKMVI
jgi:hypothetical protein